MQLLLLLLTYSSFLSATLASLYEEDDEHLLSHAAQIEMTDYETQLPPQIDLPDDQSKTKRMWKKIRHKLEPSHRIMVNDADTETEQEKPQGLRKKKEVVMKPLQEAITVDTDTNVDRERPKGLRKQKEPVQEPLQKIETVHIYTDEERERPKGLRKTKETVLEPLQQSIMTEVDPEIERERPRGLRMKKDIVLEPLQRMMTSKENTEVEQNRPRGIRKKTTDSTIDMDDIFIQGRDHNGQRERVPRNKRVTFDTELERGQVSVSQPYRLKSKGMMCACGSAFVTAVIVFVILLHYLHVAKAPDGD
jgi:hypothetical protein